MSSATALKGGPLARLAGRLCQKPEFQRFAKVDSIEAAAAWVRKTCQVDSRAQLDHDDEAAQRFHNLVRRPYVDSQARGSR